MKRAILLATLTLALSGCAHYYAQRPDIIERVEAWIAEQQYQQALDAMRLVDTDHPDHARIQAKRRAVLSLIYAFEQGIIMQAGSEADREQWQAAYATYERGLKRLPQSESIRAAQEQFIARRDARMNALRAQTAFNEGQSLLRNVRLHAEILKTAPTDRRARVEHWRAEERAAEMALDLVGFAEQALERGEFAPAGEYLELAAQLSADPQTLSRVETAAQAREAGLREQAKRTQQARERQRAREAELRDAKLARLLREYREELAGEDLVAARDLLVSAAELKPEDPELQQMQSELSASIDDRVQHGIEHGRQLYSQGKVQEALSIWGGLLKLAPQDAALAAHIARAERVLSKLEHLSRQPSAFPLPPR